MKSALRRAQGRRPGGGRDRVPGRPRRRDPSWLACRRRWPAAIDPDRRVAQAYGIFAPPESFFIGRDGRIAGLQIGELSRADLTRQLATILGKE